MGFSSLASTLSPWKNSETNLGDPSRSGLAGAYIDLPQNLEKQTLNAIYLQSWIIRKVCDYVPEASVSTGGNITLGGEQNEKQDIVTELNKHILSNIRVGNYLQISHFFCEAQKEANRSSASLIYMVIDDGQTEDQPVDLDNIKKIQELRLFDAWQATPLWGNDYISGKLEPDYYQLLTLSGGMSGYRIHKSRVLPFYGVSAPRNDGTINYGWSSDTVIRAILTSVAQLDIAGTTVNDKLQRFAVPILKIKNFITNLARSVSQKIANTLSTGSATVLEKSYEQKIKERGEALASGYSNWNVAIADLESESLEMIELKFAGIPPLLKFYFEQAQAASGLPEFIFTGKHGGNLSSLNEGERAVIAGLAEKQRQKWQGNLETIITYMMLAKNGPTQGEILEDWKWEWEPLWQQDPKKIAETQKIQAETLKTFVLMSKELVAMGDKPILTSEEIRSSVFGGAEYGGVNIVLSEEKRGTQQVSDSVQRLIKCDGFTIGLEYLPGDERFGTVLEEMGYGHIQKYKGEDGEALDCYVSESFIKNQKPAKLYKLTQLKDSEFDEVKIMIGFESIDNAKNAYLSVMPNEMYGGIEAINSLRKWDKTINDEGLASLIDKIIDQVDL